MIWFLQRSVERNIKFVLELVPHFNRLAVYGVLSMSLPSTPFDFASNRRKLTSLPRPQYSPFPTSLRPSQLSLPSISYNSPQTSNLISSFTPNGSKSVPPPRRNQQNPFDQLSAGEFESFVDGVKRKIREALDPVITPQNKAEEQTEDASVDVFGQIKGLREEIMRWVDFRIRARERANAFWSVMT